MNNIKMCAALAAIALCTGANVRSSRKRSLNGGIPKHPNKIVPAGAKIFVIEGVEIIALSEKRAIKKFQKSLK